MGVSVCDHKIVDLKAEGSPLLQGSDSTKYRILIIFQDGTSVCFLRLKGIAQYKIKNTKNTHTHSHTGCIMQPQSLLLSSTQP